MFDTFESRLVVEGYIVPETALRIGVGRVATVSGTELPVMRDSLGRPYIPGSSFKGAWRGYLEALVRGMAPSGVDPRPLACDPTSNDEAALCLSASGMRALKNAYGNDDTGLAQAVADRSCLACRTFGSPWLASHVRVRDLPVADGEWLGQFQVRDGVAIDRDKGTVAEGPYDYEVVPAGTRFALHIVAENLAPWQRGLLWLGLRALERGDVALGGFTSRGLGWVKLKQRQVRLVEGARALLDLLRGVEAGREIGDEEVERWVRAFRAELERKGAQDA